MDLIISSRIQIRFNIIWNPTSMSGKILAFAALVAAVSLLVFNMGHKDSNMLQFNKFKTEHGKFYWTPEV